MRYNLLPDRELNNLLDNLPFSIAYLDIDYRVIYGNRAFWALIQAERADVMGRPCYETVGEYAINPDKTGRDKICSFCMIADALKDKKQVVIERPLLDRFLRVTTIPETDDEGNIYRFMEVIEDITDQRRIELALRKSKEELEQRVDERTSALGVLNRGLEQEVSDRKKAEDALRETNALFETLIHALPDPVFFKDAGGRYRIVNKAMGELSGLGQEWYVGKSDDDISPPDVAAACKISDAEAIKRGVPTRIEKSYLDENGGMRFIDVTKCPVFNEQGDCAGLVGISRDITERRRAEDALAKSERSLARAQEIAHVGDWEWDIATGEVHWSDQLYRIYGFMPREIAPDYGLIVQAMHPQSRDEFLAAIDAALKDERPFDLDYTFFRKDGSVAILHTIGQVIRNAGGEPERMVGVVQDITELKRSADALRLSEVKFRTIFDSANDGMLIVDISTHRFVEGNKTICAMLGYTKDEISQLCMEDIHPAGELSRVLGEFDRQMRGEIMLAEELPVRRKDGSVFYADIGAASISLGEKIYAIGIFRDITERRRAGQQIRQSLLEKETLLREIYHRTKNNMQVIISLMRLQSRDIKDEKTLKIFSDTHNRIHSMALVHEKLYMAHDLSRVTLSSYVNDLAHALMKSYGIVERITLRLEVEDIPISIDTITPLGLVINELMTNALKYAFPDDRAGLVTISAYRGADEFIELTFRDDGIGLPGTLNRKSPETLGLRIVHSLVEGQIKGRLKIEEAGGGAAFVIRFKDKAVKARI